MFHGLIFTDVVVQIAGHVEPATVTGTLRRCSEILSRETRRYAGIDPKASYG